ncbi:tetratricopeptide repeat protein [mine drainage metagenome]|uniref:Tetratricopeptide repeat protein n=1 Tax=mine drainage metagenome TaxID=410659 RepID=A0A1J5P2B9_9ZZZZ
MHKNPAVYASLASVLVEQNDPQEALKVLSRSKAEFRFNPAAALQTAAAESRVYQKMGQADMAQEALAQAEQLVQQLGSQVSPEMLVEVARAQFKLGQKDKACALLGQVIKNNHENAALSDQIESVFAGENLLQEGHNLVLASRQEVVDINNRGVMLAKQGDFVQAAKLLRAAVKQLPSSEAILTNLCGLLIGQMGKQGFNDALATEAKELLERLHELHPGNQKYHAYSQLLARLRRG